MFNRLKLIYINNKLGSENKKLKTSNQDLRSENETLRIFIKHIEETLNDNIRDVFNAQDVDRTGLSEEDKRKNRNTFLNQIVKNSTNKLNELDCLRKQI